MVENALTLLMLQVQLLNYLELVRVSAQLSCWQLILVLHFHLLYGAHFLCGLYFNYFKLQCFKYTIFRCKSIQSIPKLGVILGKHFCNHVIGRKYSLRHTILIKMYIYVTTTLSITES